MKKILVIIVSLVMVIALKAVNYKILYVNTDSIKIGNTMRHKGDYFMEKDKISWTSPNQAMKVEEEGQSKMMVITASQYKEVKSKNLRDYLLKKNQTSISIATDLPPLIRTRNTNQSDGRVLGALFDSNTSAVLKKSSHKSHNHTYSKTLASQILLDSLLIPVYFSPFESDSIEVKVSAKYHPFVRTFKTKDTIILTNDFFDSIPSVNGIKNTLFDIQTTEYQRNSDREEIVTDTINNIYHIRLLIFPMKADESR
ncbi:MAG: hypothetical protein LIP09_05870 [Bacteroidales bacterium]|nr:hypothetical protein [Bacteroidales bacterium]